MSLIHRVDEWLALLSYLHVIDYRVDEWLAEPLRQLRCLHRHVGCLRPSDPRDLEQFRSSPKTARRLVTFQSVQLAALKAAFKPGEPVHV